MVRRSRVRAAALLSLVLPAVAAVALPTAFAQPASFSLSWQAPASCPDEAHVRHAVEQLLGEGPPPPAHVSARAVVEQTASGHWNVRLTTVRDGASGERVVESESCQSLADATALILALTIDPERVAARAPGASAAASSSVAAPTPALTSPSASAPASAPASVSASVPPPPPPPPSAVPTTAPSAAPPVESSSTRQGAPGPTLFALFAQVGGDVGTLPRAAFAIGGGVALTLGRFRVEGYGTYLPPQATYAATLQSLGTNVDLLAGGLRGCFFPLVGSLEAGGCAGLELGELHGHGFGPSLPNRYYSFTPSDAGGLWVAPTLSGRISWRIARAFALVFDVGILVPVQRDTFVIDNLGGAALHEPGPVEGRASIGPEVRF
jgi:hypothetical protein